MQTSSEPSILVAVDFSAGAERALRQAVRLAQKLSVQLHVVHICELHSAASDPPDTFIDVAERLLQQRQGQRNLCIELCERVVANRVKYSVHIFDGMPLDGLLEAIDQLKPELIVVGSYGRGPLMRTLLGSVSTALCRHSPIPVVVVPPEEQIAAAEHRLDRSFLS